MADWPTNFAQQLAQVETYMNRCAQLDKIAQPVVVHRLNPPTQHEWEAAFVSQAQQPLPIPPGTRLIWIDPTTGQAQTYTTTYDQDMRHSSGTVYPYTQVNNNLGGFRLLASALGGNPFRSTSVSSNTPVTIGTYAALPLDLIKEMQKGLTSLLVIGHIFTQDFADASSVNIYLHGTSTWVALANSAGNSLGKVLVSLKLSTNTVSAGDAADYTDVLVTNIAGGDNTNTTLRGASLLFLKIDLVAPMLVNGVPSVGSPGTGLQGFASGYLDATLTAGNTVMNFFTMRQYNSLPIFNGIVVSAEKNGVNIANTALAEVPLKMWMYGLYSSNTGE